MEEFHMVWEDCHLVQQKIVTWCGGCHMVKWAKKKMPPGEMAPKIISHGAEDYHKLGSPPPVMAQSIALLIVSRVAALQ